MLQKTIATKHQTLKNIKSVWFNAGFLFNTSGTDTTYTVNWDCLYHSGVLAMF